MKEDELIDVNTNYQKTDNITLALGWWEKKRLWFNLFVGISGILGILLNINLFHFYDIVLILFYGLFANLMYSIGFLLEAFDQYYLKSKLKVHLFRLPLFLMGVIFSCIITFVMAIVFYTFNI